MKLPRCVAPGALAFLVIWLLLLAAGRSTFFRDPGTFWHTTTGERILAQGFINTDPYTFTFAGDWWIPYQWLGEVGMALAHRLGGFDSELLGAVTILAGVFAWLTVRMLRTGLNWVVACAIVALGMAASSSHFHVRPHLFTILGLTVTCVLLVDVDAKKTPLRRLLWLIPFYIVWTNVHGGVLGGMATLGLSFAGWCLLWFFRRPSPVQSWWDVLILAIAGGGCCLTAYASPYGTDLVKTWRIIMSSPVLPEIIQEHAALDLASPSAWPVLGFAALYLFVLAGVPWRKMQISWLIPIFWLFQAYARVRHGPLFAVSGLVAIAAMWKNTYWADWLGSHRPDLYDDKTPSLATPWWANLWLPASAVLVALVLQIGGLPVPVIGSHWARHDPAHWPVELLDVLKEYEPHSPTHNHLFNEYIDGGFVIYHAPGYRVFVDDRCELFGGEWLKTFLLAEANNPSAAMAEWEKAYGGFDYALTRTDSGYDETVKNDPSWVTVKVAHTARFSRRR